MTFQEKNITVHLFTTFLIGGYFLLRVGSMLRAGGLDQDQLFRLWIAIIVLTILLNIFGIILTTIVLAIVEAVRTGTPKEPRDVEDERDKLISLKGTRITYAVASIGIALSLLAFFLGQSPLVMVSLIIFSGLVADIASDIYQLSLYRRGF